MEIKDKSLEVHQSPEFAGQGAREALETTSLCPHGHDRQNDDDCNLCDLREVRHHLIDMAKAASPPATEAATLREVQAPMRVHGSVRREEAEQAAEREALIKDIERAKAAYRVGNMRVGDTWLDRTLAALAADQPAPQRVCRCGHVEDVHDGMGSSENVQLRDMCTAKGCSCINFRAADQPATEQE